MGLSVWKFRLLRYPPLDIGLDPVSTLTPPSRRVVRPPTTSLIHVIGERGNGRCKDDPTSDRFRSTTFSRPDGSITIDIFDPKTPCLVQSLSVLSLHPNLVCDLFGLVPKKIVLFKYMNVELG